MVGASSRLAGKVIAMFFRRHLPIFIALCASVAVHFTWYVGAHDVKVNLRPLTGAHQPRPEEETTIQLSLLDPPAPKPDEPDKTKGPEDKNDPEKPKELPKPAPKKPQIDFPDEMGERTGKGIGSNKSEGIEPLKALEADEDQAFLSRNPGAVGRAANRPANWLMSPGENGRGGHPGSAAPAGAARSASDNVPVPADPLATQAPRPQETDPAPDATPPAPPDLPVPPTQVQTAADNTAEPAKPAHSQQAIAVTVQPAHQAMVPPEHAEDLKLSSVSIGPKISPTPPKPGDDAAKGSGHAGVDDDLIAMANDPASGLRRSTTQPSREAGHTDGAPVALRVPVPFIVPTRAPEPKVPPPLAKPAFALLVPPPAPMPDPAPPTIQPPPQNNSPAKEKPIRQAQDRPDVAKPAAHNPPPAPAAPSLPAPAAGASASARATGDGRQPGSERPSGDPGQMSDSESDPFSKIGSAEVLRDGKLDVRFGRKIKTVRPHLPVVGQIDSFALLNPSVTLKVNIDETGKVTEVAIHKSSGSNEIDQPTLIAMYDWWFEPLHDAKGNAVPDCVLFTINFR
jgi:TonB family protein